MRLTLAGRRARHAARRPARAIAVVATALLAFAGALTATLPSASALPTAYYLSLGDSLSVGYQPGLGDTNQGFSDQLASKLQAAHPFQHVVLVKMGCSGETTGTMINGGKCTDGRYPLGSQLKQAAAFLLANGNAVKWVTLDIGANDVDGCATGALGIDPVCVTQGTAAIAQNLYVIAQTLRAAVAHDTVKPRMVGMAYYDPFLASWLTGPQGQLVATASLSALAGINSAEQTIYSGAGFGFADVFNKFQSTTFSTSMTVAPYGKLPTAVARICQWTYMCSQANIHANPTGYGKIAEAFKAKMP
jgi:lysophospholipase L1-like esterase